MSPAYAFNTNQDRFDVHVMSALADEGRARHVRDRLIAQVRDGRLDHFLLKRLDGFDDFSYAANEKAAVNIIDFHFEPLVLRSMNDAQVNAYFCAIETALKITEASGLDEGGPLWVDTVHHSCVWSVLYVLSIYLMRQRGYRRLVLLHQGQRPEPRLAVVARVLQRVHGAETGQIQLQGNWFSKLAQVTTPDTAVFYLTDMPQEASQRAAPKQRTMSTIQLDGRPSAPIRLQTLSGSGSFARRLRASHVVVDYPGRDAARIRPYDPANPVSRCPLEDWAFWPLLKVA
ncbi:MULTISPECIES: hypothetical protein [Rhodomicrobium]|uniref:hypothetical protein n=1 Tax=Rhodomicrobium TaxID=1068 RepID=UPI000B4A78CE|nr:MULTISPECIES: hypothetical protein [Rhodomicrobium]